MPLVQKTFDRNVGCGHHSIITDYCTGESICAKCGLVTLEHMIDYKQEWRSFPTETSNRSRTGDGTSLAKHDQGLSTIINPSNKDASGRPLSGLMKKTIKQLRIADTRSQRNVPDNRNLIQAFSELNGLKDKMSLSNTVMERAAYIYRKVIERKLVRGRSISSMMAASLYAACRESETPRTLKDVAEASNIKQKEISRCYRLIIRELELKLPVANSIQCISRISSRLEITEKVKRQAVKIITSIQKHEGSAGKDPMGLAAAALYLSCIENEQDITQHEVAIAANVTEVTIRNRVKCLKSDPSLWNDLLV